MFGRGRRTIDGISQTGVTVVFVPVIHRIGLAVGESYQDITALQLQGFVAQSELVK